ncbi:MAG TPA: YbaB/EbfC family nucleoid-associated protein, partial [Jatrophihabitans sp.]
VADVAAQAQAARTRMAGVRGTETSGDGAVTVSVNVQGGLETLRFGPAASSLNLDVLASTIVTTSQQARVRAARAAADALEPLLGADSAAMAEVRSRIPTEAPLDGADGRPERDGLNEENSTTPTPRPSAPRAELADDSDESGYTRGF